MDADRVSALEVVLAYTKLTEAYVSALPVWEFYRLMDESERRAKEAEKK